MGRDEILTEQLALAGTSHPSPAAEIEGKNIINVRRQAAEFGNKLISHDSTPRVLLYFSIIFL